MTYISVFPNGNFSKKFQKIVPAKIPSSTIDFDSYLAGIRDGLWQDDTLNVRAGRWPKEQARGVTASGVFSSRDVKGLASHSGIIAIDLDSKMNPDISVDEVFSDDYVLAGHQSISGNGGYVVYVKIEPDHHLDAYLGLEAYFANKFGLLTDPSCKDVSRFRFVSHDPELYHNPNSKLFKRYLPKRKVIPRKAVFVHTQSNLDHILKQIQERHLNVLEDYHDWMRAGMALANEYGEGGRQYFHVVSSYSEKYNDIKTDMAYDAMVKTARKENGIGTFYYLCKNAGLSIKTDTSEYVERITRGRVLGGVKNVRESVLKTMELEGIEEPEVDRIIEAIQTSPMENLKPKGEDELLDALVGFLSGFDIIRNLITGRIEVDGEVISDISFSKMMTSAWERVSMKISDTMLRHMIHSKARPFNPVRDWFLSRANLKPKGEIVKLFSCIKYDMTIESVYVPNYLEVFVKKWLLSVVASAFGTHSEMMLVLTGSQGDNKTKFFRGLLPQELMPYYAESKLDEGKDSHTMMCEKLIIMDDEFGGKSKQEAKHFKDMISKSVFALRKPYGREIEDRVRLAVLCGTSNDYDVINDPTGNRRVIPLNIVEIDKEKFDKIDKERLWMELYWLWKEVGDGWMLTRDEVDYLNQASAQNKAVSVEIEAIDMFFKLPSEAGLVKQMTATEIINYIESRSKIKMNSTKIGLSLKSMGYERKVKRFGGSTRGVYSVIERFENGGN